MKMTENCIVFLIGVAMLAAMVIVMCGCSQKQKKPCVIAFTAKWCTACKEDVKSLSVLENNGVEVIVIDTDKHKNIAIKYGVTTIPKYFVECDGNTILRTHDIDLVIRSLVK